MPNTYVSLFTPNARSNSWIKKEDRLLDISNLRRSILRELDNKKRLFRVCLSFDGKLHTFVIFFNENVIKIYDSTVKGMYDMARQRRSKFLNYIVLIDAISMDFPLRSMVFMPLIEMSKSNEQLFSDLERLDMQSSFYVDDIVLPYLNSKFKI